MTKRLQSTFLLLFTVTISYGQLTVTGDIRPRPELRSGFKILASENQRAAFFFEQLSRLYLDYQAYTLLNRKIRIKLIHH